MISNYLIWAGQDSINLKGSLISELSHIVRPATRVQVVEIEGRGGDISDDIAYATYGQLVKIGLYDNYDIDRISHFFSGTEKVTFSNEPDKYYEAEITEQSDFERLVRFRTAVIKFHTQPFGSKESIEKKKSWKLITER